MSNIFHTLFYLPIEYVLMFFYNAVNQNMGVAIILLTLTVRLILLPLMLPTMKSSNKMKEIAPLLSDVKKKYKDDPKRMQEEQLKIYKEHGINPAGGCLPILLQLPILIFLYRVLLDTLGKEGINSQFLMFDLNQADKYFILPILSAVFQFIYSYMLSSPSSKKTEIKEKKDEDFASSLGSAMQTQNLYIMPLLWFFMLLKLPSGIGIYWVLSTVFSVIQQLVFIGPGRLADLFKKKQSSLRA